MRVTRKILITLAAGAVIGLMPMFIESADARIGGGRGGIGRVGGVGGIGRVGVGRVGVGRVGFARAGVGRVGWAGRGWAGRGWAGRSWAWGGRPLARAAWSRNAIISRNFHPVSM